MKAQSAEKLEEFPDTPPWTMFFDGPLYQKYDEFMRTKDFSKILLNTKLRLANSPGPEVVSSTHSIEDDHWDKEQDADPTGNTFPYVSEDFYHRVKEDHQRRTRRTRAFILLGLVIMAALAFGTALVIHYFFIPQLEERNPKNFVNVSFAINTTSNNSEIEQTTPVDHGDDLTSLLDFIEKHPHHHDHGHDHDHILNPDGKIFVEPLVTSTGFPPKNTVRMRDITSYTFENAKIECTVKHGIKWRSLSVKINQTWRPLEVTLYPSGEITWSKAKTKRHDVIFEVSNSTDGTGSNVTLGLIINGVQCRDANTYICTLKSEIVDRVATSQLMVLGKPSQKITLTLGPSIVEDRAFRITASWQGGYPIPWTNMSWTAVDANNKSYNLAEYGEYRDYELHEDHHFCQTTLQHSIVVFPKVHLNDTTVIVKPNLQKKKFFVDETMEKYLKNVEPGIDKILVIPLDYCKNGKKEMSIPHPYTPCSKFLRCLPGDMVVQLCPMGTCFYEKRQECA